MKRITLALMLLASSAGADQRVKKIAFDDDAIVAINAAAGYQVMIEFAAAEHIENVALGDATKWLVTPNRRANLLFVKALARAGQTNMSVVTDRHRYNFLLTVRTGRPAIFDMRFVYPPDASPVAGADPVASVTVPLPAAAAGAPRNTAYHYSGARELVPLRVSDDGQATRMHFADSVAIPAIYIDDGQGPPQLVNPIVRDGDIVIEQVARGFVLRVGKVQAQIVNDGFAPVARDAAAPPLGPAPAERDKK